MKQVEQNSVGGDTRKDRDETGGVSREKGGEGDGDGKTGKKGGV